MRSMRHDIVNRSVLADDLAGCPRLGLDGTGSLAASRAATARVTGRRFGIVSACAPISTDGDGAALYIYAAAGARRLPGWHFLARATGTGVSTDPELARIAAISEAVESYVSMAPAPRDRLVRSSYAALHERAVRPSTLALHSALQYARHDSLQPLTDTTEIDWCTGWSLVAAAETLIPAVLVFLTHPHGPPNNFVGEVTSTGIAAHISLAAAIVAGAYECMERDAVCIAWGNRLPLARLDPRGTAIEPLVAEGFGAGVDVQLYDVPTDSPCPTVMAIAWSAAAPPHAAIGIACRRDHERAAHKAICEAAQMRSRYGARGKPRPSVVRTFDDHADFYADATAAAQLRDFISGGARVRLAGLPRLEEADAASMLTEIVEGLRARRCDLLVAELTTPDVAAAGYRVVRVLIPGCLDTCADTRFARLGGERLYETPVALGLRRGPLPEAELNPLPSPIA